MILTVPAGQLGQLGQLGHPGTPWDTLGHLISGRLLPEIYVMFGS